jgi:hypothetical protein
VEKNLRRAVKQAGNIVFDSHQRANRQERVARYTNLHKSTRIGDEKIQIHIDIFTINVLLYCAVIDVSYAEDIEKIAREEQGVVTTRQVTAAGIPRHALSAMVKMGALARIERGIYLLEGFWEDEYLVYSLRYPKGIFSYDVALYLHELTDATPQRFTMTFPQGYNTASLANPMLDVRRAKKSLFDLGDSRVVTPSGNNVRAYNKERALCDILRGSEADDADRSRIAYQRYCASSDKNVSLLLDYASRLRVTSRVQNYLKALL